MYIGKMQPSSSGSEIRVNQHAVVPLKITRATQTNENDLCLCYIPEYNYNNPEEQIVLHPKLTVNLKNDETSRQPEIVMRNFESVCDSKWKIPKNAIKSTSGFKKFKKSKKNKRLSSKDISYCYNGNEPLQSGIYGKIIPQPEKRFSVTILARNNSEYTSHVKAKLFEGNEVIEAEDYSFYDNYDAEKLTALNDNVLQGESSQNEYGSNSQNEGVKNSTGTIEEAQNNAYDGNYGHGNGLKKWSYESQLNSSTRPEHQYDSIENIDYMSITGYDEITSISTNGDLSRRVRVIDMQSNESLEFLKSSSDEEDENTSTLKKREEKSLYSSQNIHSNERNKSSSNKDKKRKHKQRSRSKSMTKSEENLNSEEKYRAFAVVPLIKNESESGMFSNEKEILKNRLLRKDAVDLEHDEDPNDDIITASAKVARSLSFLLRNSMTEETLQNDIQGIQLNDEFDIQTYV